MVSELSDRKPGIGTALLALLIFTLAGVIVVAALYLYRTTNTYDADRSAKRYETLKQLRTENAKKTTEYAALDKAKGTYQLPIKKAMDLTIQELSAIQPHSAYPVATPVPAVEATPAPAVDAAVAPVASSAPSPAAPPKIVQQKEMLYPVTEAVRAAPAPAATPVVSTGAPAATP